MSTMPSKYDAKSSGIVTAPSTALYNTQQHTLYD